MNPRYIFAVSHHSYSYMVASATTLFSGRVDLLFHIWSFRASFILRRDTPYWLFVVLVLAIRVSLFSYQLHNPSQASRLKTCFSPLMSLNSLLLRCCWMFGPDISGPQAGNSAPGRIFPVLDRIYPVQAGISAPGAGYIRA